VRDKNMRAHGASIKFLLQLVPKRAEAGAAIENKQALPNAHFHAGSVASISQILGLRRWGRAPNPPELNAHNLGRISPFESSRHSTYSSIHA
jgi:hypothetical protein